MKYYDILLTDLLITNVQNNIPKIWYLSLLKMKNGHTYIDNFQINRYCMINKYTEKNVNLKLIE